MYKKSILFFLIAIMIPFLAYGVYRAVLIQYTVCIPIYEKLQTMPTDISNERLGLEYIYFNNNCR